MYKALTTVITRAASLCAKMHASSTSVSKSHAAVTFSNYDQKIIRLNEDFMKDLP